MKGLALALSFDQRDVAAACDHVTLAVLSVPNPPVQPRTASRCAAVEDHPPHQGACVGVDTERDGREVVELVRDRRSLASGVERVRIVRDVAAPGGGVDERDLEI